MARQRRRQDGGAAAINVNVYVTWSSTALSHGVLHTSASIIIGLPSSRISRVDTHFPQKLPFDLYLTFILIHFNVYRRSQ